MPRVKPPSVTDQTKRRSSGSDFAKVCELAHILPLSQWIARQSTHSTRLPSPLVVGTTAPQACARTITPITTVHSFSIRMDTISRLCVTIRRKWVLFLRPLQRGTVNTWVCQACIALKFLRCLTRPVGQMKYLRGCLHALVCRHPIQSAPRHDQCRQDPMSDLNLLAVANADAVVERY